MKSIIKWLVVIGAVLLLVAALCVFFAWKWYEQALLPVSNSGNVVSVIIPKGSSTRAIAEKLESEGLIKNKWVFIVYARRSGLDGEFQAGSFRLRPNQSLPDIAEALTNNTEGIWVTIIEGWRREQIVLELEKNFADNPSFSTEEFLELTEDQEGKLFPETYLFPHLATTQLVVNAFDKTFAEKTADIFANKTIDLTDEEILVLASLLEREAAKDEDLPMVAGILMNRLEADWPLQVDATLQYIKASEICNRTSPQCDNWWPTPLAVDKELDSPYNTYAITGLPPTPIGNPSLRAIAAAANPTDTEYWFYLTDNAGNMHYAVDYDQHLVNVNRYLR